MVSAANKSVKLLSAESDLSDFKRFGIRQRNPIGSASDYFAGEKIVQIAMPFSYGLPQLSFANEGFHVLRSSECVANPERHVLPSVNDFELQTGCLSCAHRLWPRKV